MGADSRRTTEQIPSSMTLANLLVCMRRYHSVVQARDCHLLHRNPGLLETILCSSFRNLTSAKPKAQTCCDQMEGDLLQWEKQCCVGAEEDVEDDSILSFMFVRTTIDACIELFLVFHSHNNITKIKNMRLLK